jgi:hypothetical protein
MNFKIKLGVGYGIVTIFIGIFSYVYLSFVPGVFNLWMVGVATVPFVGGLIELLIRKQKTTSVGWTFYRLGLATLTVQLILKGIYDIALSSFRGETYYVIAWIVFISLGLVVQARE